MQSSEYLFQVTQSLNDNLSKTNKTLNKTGDLSQEINKSMTKTKDNSSGLNKSTELWNKSLNKVKSAFNSIKGQLTKIAGLIGGLFSLTAIVQSTKELFLMNQRITDISYQMGHAGENVSQLRKEMLGVQRATGQALSEVEKMYTGLMELRVPQEMLRQLATDGLRFSEVTGAGEESVKNLIGELNRMGGMGADSISNVMANIVQVQREFGMASQSVEALTDHISKTTQWLSNMGKSAGEIEEFQKGTIKLAASFEDVGVKADEAASIVERLLDPGELENNALLYSKLGISIQDAMEGNINPDEVAKGLQGVGKELQNMGGPQASALAQSMGMNLQQLRQMGNMDLSGVTKEMGLAADGSKELAQAQEDQETPARKLQHLWENLKGTISNVLDKFMPVIEKGLNAFAGMSEGILENINNLVDGDFASVLGNIVSTLGKILNLFTNPKTLVAGVLGVLFVFKMIKNKLHSTMTEAGEKLGDGIRRSSPVIEEGVISAMEMASEKSSITFAAKMKSKMREWNDDARERMEETFEYSARMGQSKLREAFTKEDVFAPAKKLNALAARMNEHLAYGVQPLEKQSKQIKIQNERRMESLKFNQTELQNRKNLLTQLKQEADVEHQSILQARELNEEKLKQAKQAGLTAVQLERVKISYDEQNKILDTRAEKLEDYLNKRNQEIISLDGDIKKQYEKDLALLSITQRQEMLNDLAKQREEIETSSLKTLNDQKNEIEKELGFRNEQISLLERAKKVAEESNDSKKAFEINEELRKQNSLRQEQLNMLDETGYSIAEQEKMLENITAKEGPIRESFAMAGDEFYNSIEGTGSKLKAFFNNTMGDPIRNTFEKSIKSAKSSMSAISDMVSLKNIKSKLKEVGDGNLGKGILKSAASASKTIGSGVLKASSKTASGIKKALSGGAKMIGGGMKAALGPIALLGGILMSTLGESGGFKDVIEKLKTFFQGFIEKLQPAIESLMNIILELLDPIMQTLSPILNSLIEELMPIFEMIGGVISDLMKDLMKPGGPLEMLGSAIKELMPVVRDLLMGALETVGKVLSALVPIVLDLVKSLMPIVSSIIKSLMPIFQGVVPALLKVVGALLPIVLKLVNLLLPPLLFVLGTLVSAIGGFIFALGKALGLIPGLGKVGDALTEVGSEVNSAGKEMRDSAAELADSNRGLGEIMDENSRQLALNNQRQKNASRMTDTLSSKMGQNSEVTQNMTAEEISTAVAGMDSTSELRKAVIDNVNAIRDQLKENEENKMKESLIEGMQDFYNDDSMKNFMGRHLSNEIKNNNNFEYQGSGHYRRMTSESQEEYDRLRKEGRIELIRNNANDEVNALLDTLINSGDEDNLNQFLNVLSGVSNSGVREIEKGDFSNFLEGSAEELIEASSSREASRLLEEDLIKTMVRGAGVSDLRELSRTQRNDITQLAEAMAEASINNDKEEMDRLLRERGNLLGKIVAGQMELVEETKSSNENEEDLEGVTTKLYPAIVEASASGMRISEHAREVGGLSAEERTARSSEVAARESERTNTLLEEQTAEQKRANDLEEQRIALERERVQEEAKRRSELRTQSMQVGLG